jgi:hypothetical protein
VVEFLIQRLAGFNVRKEKPTGDKRTRAQPFAAQAEAGNVRIVAGEWNRDYLDELTLFPEGANDDQVDASSGAFNKLATGGGPHGKWWLPGIRGRSIDEVLNPPAVSQSHLPSVFGDRIGSDRFW